MRTRPVGTRPVGSRAVGAGAEGAGPVGPGPVGARPEGGGCRGSGPGGLRGTGGGRLVAVALGVAVLHGPAVAQRLREVLPVDGRGPEVGAARDVAGHEVDVRPQMAAADLDEVVALLLEGARHRPAAVGRDVDDGDPDAEILGVAHHLGEILVAADHDGVADGVVAGQRHQVAVDLGVHTLAPAGPDARQAQLETRDVGQRVVLGGAPALNGGLVPVAAKERQVGALAREGGQELQQTGVVPGDGFAMAGPMHGHRAVRQQVASVHEQRAAIHATPPFLHGPSPVAAEARPYLRVMKPLIVRG